MFTESDLTFLHSVQNKRGSVLSKILGKRNTSSSGLPSSKSWSSDSSAVPTRKPRRPDAHEWSIPNPPPLPTVEFLTGKSRVAHKLNFSLKEELEQFVPSSVWGRDAYDDEDDESDSDTDKPIDKQALQNKNKAFKGKGRKKKTLHEPTSAKQKKIVSLKTPSMPSISSVQVPKSDVLSTQKQPSSIQPVRPAPPPPPTPPSEQEKIPIRPKQIPIAPTPIAKVASARSHKQPGFARKDTPTPTGFATQLSEALQSAQGQKPKAFHYKPPVSPAGHEMRSFSAFQTSVTQTVGPRPKLQRQPVIREEPVVMRKEMEDSDDSSFTSSSDEETESSESGDRSDDEEEDRPIMARNMGIHGARIAKEVMQRMKNQRYPSIFRKPIITLDTVLEVRHEIVYETVSLCVHLHSSVSNLYT